MTRQLYCDLLADAQKHHFGKRFDEARAIYQQIIERYADTKQAATAQQQLENLPEQDCWTLGETEARLAALQSAQDTGALRRVALRSLFRRMQESAASGARSEAKPSEGPLG